MRNITKVTLTGSRTVPQADARILLAPAQQVVEHEAAVSKHIAGIPKQRETHVVLHVREGDGGHAQFHIIQKQCAAAQWESGHWVTRARLINPEAPMRVTPAGKEALRQWNHRQIAARAFCNRATLAGRKY